MYRSHSFVSRNPILFFSKRGESVVSVFFFDVPPDRYCSSVRMSALTPAQRKEVLTKLAAKGWKNISKQKRSWTASYYVVDAADQLVQCILCAHTDVSKTLKYQTTGMAYHLDAEHGVTKESHSVTSQTTDPTVDGIFKSLIDSQREDNLLLAYIFATRGLSHDLLNDAFVRKRFHISMSRDTLKKSMKVLHERTLGVVYKEIKNSSSVCLMCDSTQASDPSHSWLNFGVVCRRQFYFVRSFTCAESLRANVIRGYIAEVVRDIEKDSKVVVAAFCSDNGANFRSAIESYIHEHRPWAFFVRCAAHSIQLIVKDALKAVCPKLQKDIADAVNVCRVPAFARVFKQTQKAQHMKLLRLVKPVAVRWNSYYNAAQRILERWPPFFSTVSSHPVEKDRFATEEFETKLRSFCRATEPFVVATDIVQAKAFDIASLWDVLETASARVRGMEQTEDSPFCRDLCRALSAAFAERWDTNLNNTDLMTILSVVTPAKRREKRLESLPRDAHEKFMKFCVGFCLHSERGVVERSEARAVELKERLNREFAWYLQQTDVFLELTEFEAEFSSYWTAAVTRGVLIARPLLAMVDIACTQADIERSFSVEANIVQGRENLSDEQREIEIFIRMNSQFLGMSQEGARAGKRPVRTSDDDADDDADGVLIDDISDAVERDARGPVVNLNDESDDNGERGQDAVGDEDEDEGSGEELSDGDE